MNLLLLFVDGVGCGPDDAVVNPFAGRRLPGFERLVGGPLVDPHLRSCERDGAFDGTSSDRPLVRRIDACLGVDGLPQSGTGQATLFTGINCAALNGHHFGPFPPSKTLPALAQHNVFKQVADRLGGPESAAFANAYPPRFFEYTRATERWTVTTRACVEAGVRIRTLVDLDRGEAVAADLTGQRLTRFGEIDVIDEAAAADRLLALAAQHPFSCFEYFHTDKAGHGRDPEVAGAVIASYDRFLLRLLDRRPDDLTVVLTSDHGNLEDLSTRSHTLNPVPLAAVGPAARFFATVESLVAVTPAIVRSVTADAAARSGQGARRG